MVVASASVLVAVIASTPPVTSSLTGSSAELAVMVSAMTIERALFWDEWIEEASVAELMTVDDVMTHGPRSSTGGRSESAAMEIRI